MGLKTKEAASSKDLENMRDFFLTPTLALNDPLGVKSAPSVRRLPAKNGSNREGIPSSKGRMEKTEAVGVGGGGGDVLDDDDEDEEYTTLHERIVQNIKDGDPVVVMLLAIVVYLAFYRMVEHLPNIFAILVTLYGSRVYYKGRLDKAARRLKASHFTSLAWTPISPVETANWINWTATSLWTEIIAPKITDDVKLTVMRQLRITKLPWFIASAAVKQVNMGDEPPKIGNFQVMKNRYGRQVCEADIAFDAKGLSIVVRLTLRSANEVLKFITGHVIKKGGSVDIKVQNLMVEGRIRYYPLLGHPIIMCTFTQMPKVRFDVNVSGVSMTAMPQMKRFMGGVISEALGRKLIFPYGFAVELGKRDFIKPPEKGTIEVKMEWIELWKGFNTDKVKSKQTKQRVPAKPTATGKIKSMFGGGGAGQKGRKSVERKRSGGGRSTFSTVPEEEEVSGDGIENGNGNESSEENDGHESDSGFDGCEGELGDTSLEIFVGNVKPPPIPVLERSCSSRPRHPGMPETVVSLEQVHPDSDGVLRFPVNASNSRIQLELRHGGYKVHGVIMYKWCTRTCLTHAWFAAPIPDMKTDSTRISNAERRKVVFGLHTQSGEHHPIVGSCSVDIQFRWAAYRKIDLGSASFAAGKGGGAGGGGGGGEGGGSEDSTGSNPNSPMNSPSKPESSSPSRNTHGDVSSPYRDRSLQTKAKDLAKKAKDVSGMHGLMGFDESDHIAGILQVDVVQAKELPARDSNGTSDPYIKVWMNKQKAKTSVRACTLTPVWEHRMLFRVMQNEDKANSKLVLKVFDHDSLSWSDDFMGTAVVDVVGLLDGELHNKWVKLTAIESGEVRLRVKYFPGVEVAPKAGWDVEERIDIEEALLIENQTWALSGAQHVAQMLSSTVAAREGVLIVTLKNGENLVKADLMTGTSDPYCVLRCGSDRHKSSIKYLTLNPRWNQTFEFAVSPIQRVSGRMLIECRDHDILTDDDFLGNATVELGEVPDDGEVQALSLALEGVSHGMINLDVQFVPVGQALDVKEMAARSASTNTLKAHLGKNVSTGKLLKKIPGGVDGKNQAVKKKLKRLEGRDPAGSCFGGIFAAGHKVLNTSKTRTLVSAEFGNSAGGKLSTTENDSEYD